MFKKIILWTFILLTISTMLFAQETNSEVSTEMELLNILFPGTVQLAQEKPEGYGYLWGTTALTASYFLMKGPFTPDGTMSNVAGSLLNSWGSSVFFYSQYAYFCDIGEIILPHQRESYMELMASPFKFENLESEYVFPLIGITALSALGEFLLKDEGSSMTRIAEWYAKPSVNFWGFEMNPYCGTALYMGLSGIRMLGVAIAEEVAFRGAILPKLGDTWTSVTFGAMHLGNLLFVEEINTETLVRAGVQTLAAMSIGSILADRVQENEYKLGESIAFHFWWNVISSGLGLISYASEGHDNAPESDTKKVNLSYSAAPCSRGGFTCQISLHY